MDVQPAHTTRDSFGDSFEGFVALEIIIDPPFGFFAINNIISLKYDRGITPHPHLFNGTNSHEALKVVQRKWG